MTLQLLATLEELQDALEVPELVLQVDIVGLSSLGASPLLSSLFVFLLSLFPEGQSHEI